MQKLTMPQRALALLLNALTAYAFHLTFTGEFLPTGGLSSVWLILALSMWFLNLLSSPWFVPPKDAIPAAIAVIIALVSMDFSSVLHFRQELELGKWLAVIYALALLVLSSFAVFFLASGYTTTVGKLSARLTAIFGQGELIFTPAVVISILGGFQPNYAEVAALLVLWTFFVVARPYERLIALRDVFVLETKSAVGVHIGTVVRVDDPNIVRVQLNSTKTWRSNQLHTVSMPDGEQKYVVALFAHTRGTEIVGTGLCVADLQEKLPIAPRCVVSTHDSNKTAEFLEKMSGIPGAALVGFVVENSSIGTMRFEVASDAHISQGDVVFVQMAAKTVVFQIIDAETAEESFDQNPRGTHIVTAGQLGTYSPENGFEKYNWLPTMNTPVFISESLGTTEAVIGEREFPLANVPGTSIVVAGKLDDLIDYHTAILGVTGTGKTELTLGIVQEALKAGTKVFCVDFTGQYKERLGAHAPAFPGPSHSEVEDIEEKIRAINYGKFGAPDEKKALDTSIQKLRDSTQKTISEFIET